MPGAFDKYVKAWAACKLLAREFGFGDPDGFVFNMSAGYDLEGTGAKVDTYINNMKDASTPCLPEVSRCVGQANLDRFNTLDAAFVDSISPCVSLAPSLSPRSTAARRAEIERIAMPSSPRRA